MGVLMALIFVLGWIISLYSICIRRFIMAVIGFLNGLLIGGLVFFFFQMGKLATYGALFYGSTSDNGSQVIGYILLAFILGLILAYVSFKYYKLMSVLNTILLFIEIFFIVFFFLSFTSNGKEALPIIGIILFIVAVIWTYCTYLWTNLFFILYTSFIGACISVISVGYWWENSMTLDLLEFYLFSQTFIGCIVQYNLLKKMGANLKLEDSENSSEYSSDFSFSDLVQPLFNLFSLTLKDAWDGGKELVHHFKKILVEDQWYLVIPIFIHLVEPLILLFFRFTGVYQYLYSTYPQVFNIRYILIQILTAFSIGQYIYLVFNKKWASCLLMVGLKIVGIILISVIFYTQVAAEILVTSFGFLFFIFIRNILSLFIPSFSKLMILSGITGLINATIPMYSFASLSLSVYSAKFHTQLSQASTWFYIAFTLLGTLLCIYLDPHFSIKGKDSNPS